MLELSKWDKRFIELSHLVASWSKDPTTKVGAVVTQGKKVISLGFNGFPSGVLDLSERLNDRGLKRTLTVHAEANAVLSGTLIPEGCTIYCTFPPCVECTKVIIQKKFSRVVTPCIEQGHDWTQIQELSKELLLEAGVTVDHYESISRTF